MPKPAAMTTEPSDAVDEDNFVSFEELEAKPRRTLTFPVIVSDGEGGTKQREMVFKALSGDEYDQLLAAHPPTPREKLNGAVFDVATFAPALIAAVSHTPKLTVAQATKLWNNKNWSGGEVSALFYHAQRVCNTGIDVPFNERG